MTGLYLALQSYPGSTITECCKEASRIATMLRVNVEFKFNDLMVTCQPDEPFHAVVDRYWLQHNKRWEDLSNPGDIPISKVQP